MPRASGPQWSLPAAGLSASWVVPRGQRRLTGMPHASGLQWSLPAAGLSASISL